MQHKLHLTAVLVVAALASLLGGCGQPAAPPPPPPTDTPVSLATGRSQRIQRVESGLIPVTEDREVRWGTREGIAERMAFYHVPGVGIAVINDYQIDWAKGYGVFVAGGDERVTPDTLFHACSTVKTLSAAAVLTLAERGLLDLDEDVNDRLVSWHVPQNEFTVEEKVTLRRLLSHSSGLTDGWSEDEGQAVECCYAVEGRAPTVTIQEMLEAAPVTGLRYPARVTMVPGTEYRYANLGYGIVQLMIEDVTREPFAAFMQETVLDPLGMTSSTFEQPLPTELRARATTEHDASGKPFEGRRHHFPTLAAGGLWTTPSDLARFAIEVMRAYAGESGQVLSAGMARQMLTPEIDVLDPLEDACGLGFHLADDGGALRMSHTGGTWGSTCLLWAYPETGQGAVIMTNSRTGEGAIRLEILLSIAAEYEWPLAAPDR
jgi:CubicO group peptidase (beta-lactamase class C family)